MGDRPTDARTKPVAHRALFVFCLLLIGLIIVAGPRLRFSQWRVAPNANPCVIEALAWRSGHVDITKAMDPSLPAGGRPQDTALFQGRVYNVYPPLFTFITYAALKVQDWQHMPPGSDSVFSRHWYIALIALFPIAIAFWCFFRAGTQSSEALGPVVAVILTVYLALCTPLWPMLGGCRDGSVAVNHVLSSAGLLLIAGDLLGARRIWPAAVGCLIGMWSRQLTALYWIPIFVAAFMLPAHGDARRFRWVAPVLAAAIGFGVLGYLNFVKFGSVLDAGYAKIYEGRHDLYAQRYAEHASLFHPGHIPRNAWHLFSSPPRFEWHGGGVRTTGHPDGTSILLTCPLLIFVLIDARKWWQDPPRRWLMLASVGVLVGLLCYHNTGSVQRGYHRFALDVIPVWLAVIAPYVWSARRRAMTLGCMAISGLYFYLLT